VYKFNYNLFIVVLLLMACKDIPRDNILDPHNPNSYQSSTILIEAFVNTYNPLSYNQWALQALDSVKEIYGSKILIAEYHRDTDRYSDPYSKLIFEPLYDKYVENSSEKVKGMPDIFVNGTDQRVQGASGVNSVMTRVNTILSKLTIDNTHFTLEPADVKVSGTTLEASCKIARLGNQIANNLLLRLILIQKVNSQELKRVVTDLKKSSAILRLEAGEITTIKFDPIPIDERPNQIIFSLTSSDELTIYQNIKVDL
jgi:hypothetical protein